MMEGEAAVGIRGYVSATVPGFRGVLKRRFADFIVHEVDSEGRVVTLRDQPRNADVGVERGAAGGAEKEEEEEEADVSLCDAFAAIAGSNSADVARALLENPSKYADPVLLPAFADKDVRRRVHGFVREHLPASESETLEGGVIQIVPRKSEKSGGRRGHKRSRAADDGGEIDASFAKMKKSPYTHFTLAKRNVETQDCVAMLCRALRVAPAAFGFAGTKDKRGVTFQRVSAKNVVPARLHQVNKKWSAARGNTTVAVGAFCASASDIKLGQLSGNKFVIVLRQLAPPAARKVTSSVARERETGECGETASSSSSSSSAAATLVRNVRLAMRSLTEEGFINHYGMQRFGRGLVRTHVLGLELLKRNWLRAAALMLKSWRCGDGDASRTRDKLVECLETAAAAAAANTATVGAGDVADRHTGASAADSAGGTGDDTVASPTTARSVQCKELATKLLQHASRGGAVAERCVLKHIGNNGIAGGSMVHAFKSIPRNLRVLYVHAFQSYVWNMAASHRIETYGMRAVVGDVVASRVDDGAPARIIRDAEELEAASYTIFDVLLPLPGHEMLYPRNRTGDVYRDLVEKEGLELPSRGREGGNDAANGRSDATTAEFQLSHWPGTYRRVVCKPVDVGFKIVSYESDGADLTATELSTAEEEQRIKATARVVCDTGAIERNHDAGVADASACDDVDVEGEGAGAKNLALIVSFTLPSSSYATMAIRELTKCSDDELREMV